MSLEKGTAYCGENTLTWSAVKNFNEWNAGTKWLRDLPYVVSMSKKSLTIGDPGSVMLNALLQARHCGATNPQDKVHALLPLLHLSGKQFNITPRYGDSLVKVYTDWRNSDRRLWFRGSLCCPRWSQNRQPAIMGAGLEHSTQADDSWNLFWEEVSFGSPRK